MYICPSTKHISMHNQLLLINMRNNDWINLVFISIFILLVINKLLFQTRFSLLLSGILNRKYLSFYIKDSPLIASSFNIIFLPINILTVSFVLFFTAKEYYPSLFENYNFSVFILINIGVFTFLMMKTIFNMGVNSILSISKSARQFSFFKLSIRSFSSIVLLPILLFYQYSALDTHITLTVLLTVFIILLAFQYIYSTRLIITKERYSFLYIFLYLCTLEFATAIIFIKLVFIIVNNYSNSF